MPEAQQQLERRQAARIDKVFRVLVASDLHGEQWYVARNISPTGMFVEMAEPLPLRCKVVVRFCADSAEGGSICAMAQVQNHYYLQYQDGAGLRALCGVGLRFLRFLPELGAPPPGTATH
ncbi:MAG: pilus assembly protein PilZ [Nannocystaceae bacterium]|nr:pilus assembly protein PilZ [Nannocystaceae bacterium]